MRSLRLSLLAALLLLSGCYSPPQVDRIELHLSGQESVALSVDHRGKGTVQGSVPAANQGAFSITPDEYAALVQRLEPFRR